VYLRQGWRTRPQQRQPQSKPPNKPEQQEVLPGVIEKLAWLRSEGYKIGIVSNQGGVAWGFITPQEARALMDDCAEKIGGADYVTFCPYDSRAAGTPKAHPIYAYEPAIERMMRKPAPGMLFDAMWALDCSPNQTSFVGDQESDERAAKAAGVIFYWAKDFFEWE
jgi:HAD superfamily hydrolase (TIGR01662 family)